MGWCMENCQCHSYLHRHCWTSEIKKSEENALHVGFTNSLPQAVVAPGGVGTGVGAGGTQGTRHHVCPVFLCQSQRTVPFTALRLKATLGTLLLAFASR